MGSLDEKVISELKALMGDDYVSVYEAFIRSVDQSILSLDKAIKHDDIKSVESIVHTLKGSSANVGAREFSRLCSVMLDEIRNGIMENLHQHFSNISSEYEDVNKSIVALLK